MDYHKYKRGYYMPPQECMDWAKKEYIEKAPKWCSVRSCVMEIRR